MDGLGIMWNFLRYSHKYSCKWILLVFWVHLRMPSTQLFAGNSRPRSRADMGMARACHAIFISSRNASSATNAAAAIIPVLGPSRPISSGYHVFYLRIGRSSSCCCSSSKIGNSGTYIINFNQFYQKHTWVVHFWGGMQAIKNNDDWDCLAFFKPRPSKLRDAAALQSVLQNTALMFQSPPDSPWKPWFWWLPMLESKLRLGGRMASHLTFLQCLSKIAVFFTPFPSPPKKNNEHPQLHLSQLVLHTFWKHQSISSRLASLFFFFLRSGQILLYWRRWPAGIIRATKKSRAADGWITRDVLTK